MGVKGLWEVLAPVRTSRELDELTGQTVAVDFSGWLCQCKSVADLPPTQYLRSLFYRTTHLMRLGVKLVFVMDGIPPTLKLNAMSKRQIGNSPIGHGRRLLFNNSNPVEKARQMLEYLGLPCLQAHGEADVLCALLSLHGLVDGCITEDGDTLLYGARRVYKNFTMDKQDSHVDSYSMGDIEESLGLSREDLVTLALLTGCDYDQEGVKHVGPEKAVRLIKTLKSKHDSALNRICNWRECTDVDQTTDIPRQLDRHCSRCHHPGTIVSHKSEGCSICETRVKCLRDKDQRLLCPCDWHIQERKLNENSLEIKIREKALLYKTFPNKELVREFLENSETLPETPLVWRKPSLSDLMNCAQILKWGNDQALSKVIPTLVSCDMKERISRSPNNQIEDSTYLLQPVSIVKVRHKDFKPCYEVQWKKLAEDVWSLAEASFYTTIVEQEAFTSVFPDMTKSFEQELELRKAKKAAAKKSPKGQKRKMTNVNSEETLKQTALTEFFGIKKKSTVFDSKNKQSDNTAHLDVICVD